MTANWLGELLGGDQTLDAISNALVSTYGWAREWQALLAGLLVLIAGLIVARSIRKASPVGSPPPDRLEEARQDMRRESRAMAKVMAGPGMPDTSAELVRELEHLRSLIRSALSAFTLTAEKENSPVLFLCQRVARLRPDRFPLHAGAPSAQRELYAGLLEQLESLRQQLKQEIKPMEVTATLIQLNASARGLVAGLAPSAGGRRQTGSDLR